MTAKGTVGATTCFYSNPLSQLFFFRTVQIQDCNIFTNMQKGEFRQFRALCIEMVLHTDMSQHFSQLKSMKTMLQQNSSEPR
jgi:histidyl-tRNA synthetase